MNIFSLLADQINETADNVAAAGEQAFKAFKSVVNVILPITIAVLLVLAIFYGVQLGVKYAKAEEDDEKKKAKGSLINCIVGFLIAIVFVVVIEVILNSGMVGKIFNNGITLSNPTATSAS